MKTVRVVSLACGALTGPPLHSYQILSMSMDIKVMERTRMRLQYFCFRGDNYITNIVRVVSLACDTPTGPLFHPNQILSNYLKQYGSYGLHKSLASGEITTEQRQ